MKKKVSGNTKSLIISLFAVLSCLTASHASAQTARVTIGMRQVKMEQVMNEIEKQTRYLFIHDKNLDTDRTVSVEVRDRPVAEALEQMVGGTGLTYEINGSNIILSERRGGGGAPPRTPSVRLQSRVRDEGDRRARLRSRNRHGAAPRRRCGRNGCARSGGRRLLPRLHSPHGSGAAAHSPP